MTTGRLYVNIWGLAGNGKTTILKCLVKAFGEDAFVLKKDTTKGRQLRPGEEENPEYRRVPFSLVKRRAELGHYRYPPEDVNDGGQQNYNGIPKQEFFQEIPPGKLIVLSAFPVDLRFPVSFPDRETVNLFTFVPDIRIVEARLRSRAGTDPGSFEHKMRLNREYREGTLHERLQPPHFYFPSLYHQVDNGGNMAKTLEQLVWLVPGLAERLGMR